MKKKRNTVIAIVLIVFILLLGATTYILNFSKDDSTLTVLEKKWITDNLNKMIDIDVYNDIPVFGYNGSGMIFDFLNYATKQNQINFNKVSYYTNTASSNGNISFKVLKPNEQLKAKDIVLYEDEYAIYAKEDISFDETKETNLGYLEEDGEVLQKYFPTNIHLTSYKTEQELEESLEKNQLDAIVLAENRNMTTVLSNHLIHIYHLTYLRLNYILRAEDETIRSILKKVYLEYLKTEYNIDYSKNYLEVYFNSTNTDDILRKNYNAKTYKYGYVVNMPYENNANGNFVGTISNYLTDFDKIADTDIEAIRYNSIDELKGALVRGEVDFALGNFDYKNINMKHYLTNPIKNLDYVVLSKKDYAMNSLKGLKNKKISVVSSSLLSELCKENNLSVISYNNTDELLRSIDDESILLLDKQAYLYYKNTKLKDEKINFESTEKNGYRFIMNSENETFNHLFNYYISNVDYEQIKYLYRTNITIDKDYTSVKVFLFLIGLIAFLIASILFINRKNITNKSISKEEILKYIDPMTSLKNRSYLNMNIYNWDDNVIFPQSVVVMDLNNLKEVNDKLGREAGDEMIKKVASILINNQLENTDIIRSGGDEFLIYMVGYDEKKVSEYTKKLTKLMKDIPNFLGIEVGYSMILDEVKSVDDAINEAILMMMKNKEKRK